VSTSAEQPESGKESDNTSEREMTTIALKINIAGEMVQFTVALPTGPAVWEDLLPFMRSLIKVGSEITQEHFTARGKAISCRAGCGICCRQRVPLLKFEAHRLKKLIDDMPEPRRSTVLARFQAAQKRIDEAGESVAWETSGPFDIKEERIRGNNYFRLLIPCPFLENESCSIYEERPLRCREYLVTSPAENCGEPQQDRIDVLPLSLDVFFTALNLSIEPEFDQAPCLPLTDLVDWTMARPPSTPSRTGPELLQEFMSKLVQPKQ
jgi:Fe-S-cluster containining protein